MAHVEFERSLRSHWERAADSWRKLRTTFAMETFNKRLASREFAEPRERTQQFAWVSAPPRP